jgi:hypothetical protein
VVTSQDSGGGASSGVGVVVNGTSGVISGTGK